MEVIIFPEDCSGCPLVDLVLVSGSSSFLFLNLINILFFLENGFFFFVGFYQQGQGTVIRFVVLIVVLKSLRFSKVVFECDAIFESASIFE